MAPKEETVETVSEDGSNANAVASRESSSSDLKTMGKDGGPQRKIVSLEERGKIPNSFYLSVTLILTMHFCADIWSPHVLQDWVNSMHMAGIATRDTLVYLRDLTQAVFEGKITDWAECGKAFIFTGLVGSLLYVLFVAPFRAGFWTGSRSSKHKMHRYMGLAYLVQYFAVWTNFLVNYESTQNSYLSHFIALNGRYQCYGFLSLVVFCSDSRVRSTPCLGHYFRHCEFIFFVQVSSKGIRHSFPSRSFQNWRTLATTRTRRSLLVVLCMRIFSFP